MNSKTNFQRGYAVLFSVFIIATMVASTLALVRVFAPRIRGVAEAINSTVAIFAADAASEACLYEARRQPAAAVTRPLLTNGATFEIASLSAAPIDVTNDCRPLKNKAFKFRATGTYRGVSRALELNE